MSGRQEVAEKKLENFMRGQNWQNQDAYGGTFTHEDFLVIVAEHLDELGVFGDVFAVKDESNQAKNEVKD